jgi:RNA polymerase sigma factor (sigma-70 family)
VEEYRRLLTTYAYNILGSVDDAMDAVQDTYLKFSRVDHEKIADPKAYLVRMVINTSIDHKQKKLHARSDYPGTWLPEPVASETADAIVNSKDLLSYSLMVLLEKLNPRQRAVFILKEAFNYTHQEISEALSISQDNSRTMLSRAKDILKKETITSQPGYENDLLLNYVELIRKGETERLERLLNEEIMLISDGGGKATAAKKPLLGRQVVMAFLGGIHKKFYSDTQIHFTILNHQPAFLYYNKDGVLANCQILTIDDDQIIRIFIIRNPEKLRRLQETFDTLSHPHA